jgi:hypothetical protein
MRRSLQCAALAAFLVGMGAHAWAATDEQDAAIAVSNTWLKLVDSGNYKKSWEETADSFRKVASEEKWEEAIRGTKAMYGALQNRKPPDVAPAKDLPGMPDGNYNIVQYMSQFTNKKAAVETVVLEKSGQKWKVAGYFIK